MATCNAGIACRQPNTVAPVHFSQNCLLGSPPRDWHKTRIGGGVLIAVPNCQGRVSPVFDVAARLLLVRFDGPVELERKDVVMFETEPAPIVRDLRELGVELLICGGISHWLQRALEQAGIEVLTHICGELEPVLAAYRTGRLNRREFTMPGCGRQSRVEPHGIRQHWRQRKRLRRAAPTKVLELE